MADYQMTLTGAGASLRLPVLPEKLVVKAAGQNSTANVLGLGEINQIKPAGLREISWEGLFPANAAPYLTGRGASSPVNCVRALEAMQKSGKPLRLTVAGGPLAGSFQTAIESFAYEERGGETGDIYYSISLKEWRDYTAKAAVLQGSGGSASSGGETRAGEPEEAAAKTHTVVKGDSLWAIAKRYYGDGSQYPALYEKNKGTIDARNKGTGNPKYTIYPGEVLLL